jgi:hypothetical protein
MNWLATRHAIERYVERVKPAVDDRHARMEIEALARTVEAVDQPPSWAISTRPDDGGRWLHVTEDISFICQGDRVVSVLTRDSMSDERREKRRIEKRKRRRQRRLENRMERSRPGTVVLVGDGLVSPEPVVWDKEDAA